jgi:tRNA(Leu) C34 or U34 (ribose-2'-O)-methylase TrmL
MKARETPAVVLSNPKYVHNLGGIIRACSCFDVETLVWTGERLSREVETLSRIPREERMKGYRDVEFLNHQRPFDLFPGAVPVAVELHETSQSLSHFEHPENAVYVFGPEDGSIPQVTRRFCHYFVHIPSRHCLNLSAAVNVVLADRMMKRQRDGLVEMAPIGDLLNEPRGFATPGMEASGWDGK